ncbi:hypothetical protein M0812_20351 [Anaeramoeba flamelloides]|uniref:Uncharacterized protein n=1 Tax=Anaeramoeba flamelloides TaxID=1746091 RepID=A0AAV7Z266_9EUKA|nr:hypothetical protein M0812_20351 [Anaeramoeba flamelloides]
MSKYYGRPSWCEDTEQLVVSFYADDVSISAVQMIDLGEFSATPTLIGEVFEVKNPNDDIIFTEVTGISCDGPNEKVFVAASTYDETNDKSEVFGFLYDVSEFDGTYTQIWSDLVIFSEDGKEVDGSSDSKVTLIGDSALVHEDQNVENIHFDSLPSLGESKFAVPYCIESGDLLEATDTKRAAKRGLRSKPNLKGEGEGLPCYYRVYELNEEKDGFIALTDENIVT